ncbi:MAG: hypothetical protein K6G16_01170 [Lachnospiraceae bacterium]|nr:hypothetical protein [Lachnospiraceae bacterium]
MAKPVSVLELITTLRILTTNTETRGYELLAAMQAFVDNGEAALEEDWNDEDMENTALHGLQFNTKTGDDLYVEMAELAKQFRDGNGGEHWKANAARALRSAMEMLRQADDSDLKKGSPAERFASSFGEEYALNCDEILKSLLVRDTNEHVSGGMRSDIADATTYPEFVEIMAAMQETLDSQEVGSAQLAEDFIYDAMELLHRDRDDDLQSEREPFRGMVTDETVQSVREALTRACVMMDHDVGIQPVQVSRSYEAIMDVKREKRDSAAKDILAEKAHAEHLAEVLPNIQDLQLKMKEGDTWWHINSSSYRRMKTAVDEVCRLADDYDPKSRKKAVEMQKAMDRLHEASKAYVESKVYDKKKSTEMGVSRKNTALALMELSFDQTRHWVRTDVDLNRIDDWRMKQSDTGKTRVKLGFDGLQNLVAEEMDANRTLRQTREQEARERREKEHEKAAKKKSQKTTDADQL